MNTLQDRKRDLLLESELNRQMLRLECHQVQMRFNRIRESWVHNAWTWAAPLAGIILARRFNKSSGFLAKGSLVATLLHRAWDFWQRRRGKTAAG
jgi:hypothetical protein